MGREAPRLIGEVRHTRDAVGSGWSGRRKGWRWLVAEARQQGGCPGSGEAMVTLANKGPASMGGQA